MFISSSFNTFTNHHYKSQFTIKTDSIELTINRQYLQQINKDNQILF
jgi:hypothetical protein